MVACTGKLEEETDYETDHNLSSHEILGTVLVAGDIKGSHHTKLMVESDRRD